MTQTGTPPAEDRSGNIYVIYTATGYEEKVQKVLREYILLPSEEAFFPVVEIRKRFHGKEKIVDKSLYPGYLFIRTEDPKAVYLRGKADKGQLMLQNMRMLRNDAVLLPIAPEEEQMLYELCGENHRCDMSKGFIVGGKVVITSGPLKTFTGKIRKINRHKKTAEITTRLLGRDINVVVGLEIVKKIDG